MNYLLGVFLENSFAPFIFWILAYFAVLGISLEFRSRFSATPATGLLFSGLGILNILYWGTFFNFFITQILLLVAGFLGLVRNREHLKNDKTTYLTILVLVMWFAGICLNTIPFSWDEFFWTLFDQHISQFSHFWTTKSAILVTHIRYMPGASLWHNFFGIKGHYNEATAYFANSVLFLIFFYWLVEQGLKENRLFLAAVLFLSLGSFSEGWYSLYVDPFVAITTAISLLAGLKYFEGDDRAFLLLFFSLSGGILFKETGVIPTLALIASLVPIFFKKLKADMNWKMTAVGLLYCFALLISWKMYQSSIGASNPIQAELFTDFSAEMLEHRKNVVFNFLEYAVTNYMMLGIWALAILTILGLRKFSFSAASYFYFLLFIAGFICVHLISWTFLVGKIDGLGLAGSTRYMGALSFSLYIALGVLLASKLPLKIKHQAVLIFFLIWGPLNLLRFGIKPSALFMLVTPHPKQVPLARKEMARLKGLMPVAELKSLCQESSEKVWFIYQESIGLEAMMARHILVPCQVSYGSWSLGEPYYEGDIWTANYSDKSFLDMASTYRLIALAHIDEKFKRLYGHHFTSPPEEKSVYKFDESAKKYVLLPDRLSQSL